MRDIITFVLTGSVPPKKTSQKIITPRQKSPLIELDPRFKRKRIIVSSDAHRKWQEDAAWQLKIQKEQKGLDYTINYRINLAVRIFKASIAEFDLSNAIQSIEDALEMAGVIQNDNLIYSFDGSEKIIHAAADGATIKISRYKSKEKI